MSVIAIRGSKLKCFSEFSANLLRTDDDWISLNNIRKIELPYKQNINAIIIFLNILYHN